ncbi:hypothetical protein ACRAWF_29350, partial [Streptomyces sp. L7]
AISAVGSATVWRFMDATQPAGTDQTGLLNGVVTAFGHDPVPGSSRAPRTPTACCSMMMLPWGQAGFSMVLLSAAIKGVPAERERPPRRREEGRIFWHRHPADQRNDHHRLRRGPHQP